ncbi:MAG: 4-hydroxy-tetrahydrodipicolinate reductase [Gammaproteobacteria bacterium RIFCSPHIGHO2_12_FULL_43_28]|nr:MAG: 4-hydroxy-tetrahydrodipicolinate reductase [Gammaproteobacteria bacterium RIFCSPHIGHO2_12_FULL_43_28]
MTIKVLVNGAFGRMGQMTVNAINTHPRLTLVGQTGREYDLVKSIQDSGAEVVVDFTHPEAVYNNVIKILDAGARPVIGTSGLTKEQVVKLQHRAAELKIGGLIAPNFSLGAVLMMKYAREIAKYMPNVEIIEMHHNNKADAPSGTAIRTAEMIAESIHDQVACEKPCHETLKGSRGAKCHNIPIHAIRLPGLLAHQQVIFGESGETLTLRHDSIERQSFMPGVCLACEKVMKLDRLVYGLEEIL